MASFDVPDVEGLISLTRLIAKQVDEYADMVRDCQRAPGQVWMQNRQSLREQAELVTRSSAQLQALISEPSQWMAQAAWSYCDSVALSLSLEMGIPTHIEPGEEGTTMDHLAECTGASPALISERHAGSLLLGVTDGQNEP